MTNKLKLISMMLLAASCMSSIYVAPVAAKAPTAVTAPTLKPIENTKIVVNL